MERLAIGIKVDALLDIILNDEEDMAGLAIGRRLDIRLAKPGDNTDDIFTVGPDRMIYDDTGFEVHPYVPQFYKIVFNETIFRYGSIDIEIDPDDLSYYTLNASGTKYDVNIPRPGLDSDYKLDYIDNFSINRGASTDFAFTFFSKEELEGIISLSTENIILSGAIIQPGRGAGVYGGEGTQYFTLKIENDNIGPGPSANADIGLPEFVLGPPCPPYWR